MRIYYRQFSVYTSRSESILRQIASAETQGFRHWCEKLRVSQGAEEIFHVFWEFNKQTNVKKSIFKIERSRRSFPVFVSSTPAPLCLPLVLIDDDSIKINIIHILHLSIRNRLQYLRNHLKKEHVINLFNGLAFVNYVKMMLALSIASLISWLSADPEKKWKNINFQSQQTSRGGNEWVKKTNFRCFISRGKSASKERMLLGKWRHHYCWKLFLSYIF